MFATMWEWFRAHEGRLLAGTLMAAVLFGWHGYTQWLSAAHAVPVFPHALYLALQLLVLQSGAIAGPIPWTLEVGRFLGALVFFLVVMRIVGFWLSFATLRPGSSDMPARHDRFGRPDPHGRHDLAGLHGHVIVFGDGALGVHLARALREKGEPDIILVDPMGTHPALDDLRDRGVHVVLGNARSEHLLRRIGVERARFLFAVSGDDEANIDVVYQAWRLTQDLAAQGKAAGLGEPVALRAFAEVGNILLERLLATNHLFSERFPTFRARALNMAREAARHLLFLQPPDSSPVSRTTNAPPQHILLAGWNDVIRELILQLARIGHFPNEIPLTVTLLADDAEQHERTLSLLVPGLKKVVRLVAADVSPISVTSAHVKFIERDGPTITSAYVSLQDDAATLICLQTLRRLLPPEVPMAAAITPTGPMSRLLATDPGGLLTSDPEAGRVTVFEVLPTLCRPEILLDESHRLDRLTRAVHEQYLRRAHADFAQARQRAQAAGETPPVPKPAMVPWNELPEEFRDNCRGQADHLWVKLRILGWEIRTDSGDEPAPVLSDADIEVLARVEHSRWYANRLLNGWEHGERDDRRKLHPDLIPYENLSEALKEYDRDTVRGIPTLLAELGWSVRPAAISALAPNSPMPAPLRRSSRGSLHRGSSS